MQLSILRTIRRLSVGVTAAMLLLVAGADIAQAQIISEGSIYSRFGLGESIRFTNSRAQSMGGGGLAINSTEYLSVENPAALSNQLFTRFVAGFQYQGNFMRDDAGNSNYLTTGYLNGVQFGFPLIERKWGVGLAFQPATRVGYRIVDQQTLDGSFGEDDQSYDVSYEGGGGLFKFDVATALRIGTSLSLGGGLRVLTGNLDAVQRTSFDDAAYLETIVTDGTRLYGAGGHFGVYVEPGNLGENKLLSFAATFTTPISLTARRIRTIGESLSADSLGAPVNGTVRMPYSASLGALYSPDERWTFIADATYEPWSSFESDFSFGGFNTADANAAYKDKWRVSAGAEIKPAGNDRIASYRKRISYRLGGYIDQAYFEPKENIEVTTYALTAGLGLPTRTPGNFIDVNLEAGMRGTTNENLVQDLFYRASVTLNFGERWFVRPKIR